MSDLFDSDERKQQDEAERAAVQAQLDSDLKITLDSPEARRVLWRLIDDVAGAHSGSYAPGDPVETAMREGKRAVGIWLRGEIQRVSPTDYVHMIADALSEQHALERAAESADADADAGPSE